MKTLVYFASGQYYPDYEALPYDRVILVDSYLHAPESLQAVAQAMRNQHAAEDAPGHDPSHPPLRLVPRGGDDAPAAASPARPGARVREGHRPVPRSVCRAIPANPPQLGDFDLKVWCPWSVEFDPACSGRKEDDLVDLENHIFGFHLIDAPQACAIWKRGKIEGWKMDCWQALKLFPAFGVTIDCFVCVNEGVNSEGGGRYYINSAPFLREAAPLLAKDYVHVLAKHSYDWEEYLPGFLDTREELHAGDPGWLDARPLMHFGVAPSRAFRRVR